MVGLTEIKISIIHKHNHNSMILTLILLLSSLSSVNSFVNTNEEITWPSLISNLNCDNTIQITSIFCDKLVSESCLSSVIVVNNLNLIPSSCVDYNNPDLRRRCFYPITDFGDSLSLLEINQAFGVDFSFSVFKPPIICGVVRRYRQYIHLDDILFKRYCIVELISFPI